MLCGFSRKNRTSGGASSPGDWPAAVSHRKRRKSAENRPKSRTAGGRSSIFRTDVSARVCASPVCVCARARSFPVTRGPASPSRPFARVQWTRSEVAAPRSNNKCYFISSRSRWFCRPPHITFSSAAFIPSPRRKSSLPLVDGSISYTLVVTHPEADGANVACARTTTVNG